MDALPIVINQEQLKLLQNSVDTAISELKNKEQAGQFASADDQQKQQNFSTYGTDQYEKASQLLQDIASQLQSQLANWQDSAETSKPVAISLNSHQTNLLHSALQEKSQSAEPQTKHLLEDLLEQLPESSPQEDTD